MNDSVHAECVCQLTGSCRLTTISCVDETRYLRYLCFLSTKLIFNSLHHHINFCSSTPDGMLCSFQYLVDRENHWVPAAKRRLTAHTTQLWWCYRGPTYRRYGWATVVTLVEIMLASRWQGSRSLALRWPSASILGAYAKISVGVSQLLSLPLSVIFSLLSQAPSLHLIPLVVHSSLPSSNADTLWKTVWPMFNLAFTVKLYRWKLDGIQ